MVLRIYARSQPKYLGALRENRKFPGMIQDTRPNTYVLDSASDLAPQGCSAVLSDRDCV